MPPKFILACLEVWDVARASYISPRRGRGTCRAGVRECEAGGGMIFLDPKKNRPRPRLIWCRLGRLAAQGDVGGDQVLKRVATAKWS